MTDAPTWTWVIPLATAAIALGGVLFTIFIQNMNFRKQIRSAHTLKIAEMRQLWINNLRDEMSKFQSYGVTPDLDHARERQFYEHGTRIELLMNPNDPDYNNLQDCLYKYLNAKDMAEKFAANPHYISLCQKILKREWEKLQSEVNSAAR